MTDEIFGTGVCGINCLTCKLSNLGLCTPCGGGKTAQATKKLGAQLKSFGGYCPILKCAVDRGIGFCMRDCEKFPCTHFKERNYPFGQGFLEMQERRRQPIKNLKN